MSPGEDLILLTVILEAALFTAATNYVSWPTVFYVYYKAQASLTDDIKINSPLKIKKATMATHRLSIHLVICLHWKAVKSPVIISLLLH